MTFSPSDPAALVHAGREQLRCDGCGVMVLVTKNSLHQTCVQWTTQAELGCPELTAGVATGRPPALVDHCSTLRRTIDDAVRAGRLVVPGGEGS